MKRASAAALALLAGCSSAPPYAPPAVAIPPQFREAGGWAPAVPADHLSRGDWWRIFRDPVLDRLERQAAAASPTIAAALARRDQAAAFVREARADLVPQVDAGADAARQRFSAGRPFGGTAVEDGAVSLGASARWEVDLWGRIRNQVRASEAEAASAQADLASAQLSVQADLATAYFRLRGLDAERVVLRDSVAAFTRARDLTEARHEGGAASGIDVGRARTQLARAQSELDLVVADRAVAEHRIAALSGQLPAMLSIAADAALPEPAALPTGIASTLLQRRPDIAAAERRVAAANARIGSARAAFFPTLTLEGSGGWQSGFGGLFEARNAFWALGPASLLLPLIDGGRRAAGVRQARAQFEERAADYRGTVLAAFQQVEDGIVNANQLASAAAARARAARAATATRDLALIRYRDGASDYLEVVVAQTDALEATRDTIDLKVRRLQAMVELVRATGGGFDGSGTPRVD